MDDEFEALYGSGSAPVAQPAATPAFPSSAPAPVLNSTLDEDDLFNQLYGNGPPKSLGDANAEPAAASVGRKGREQCHWIRIWPRETVLLHSDCPRRACHRAVSIFLLRSCICGSRAS